MSVRAGKNGRRGVIVEESEKEFSQEALSSLEQTVTARTDWKRGRWLPGNSVCLLLSIAVSVATLFAYDHWYAQKIVAVDLKGYITLQRYKYRDGKINDEDLRKAFDRLEREMDAIPKNRVVIMADTAIRNAEVFKLGHEEELKQYEELLRRSLQRNPAAQEQ
jgi:dephospho-CoA kinase